MTTNTTTFFPAASYEEQPSTVRQIIVYNHGERTQAFSVALADGNNLEAALRAFIQTEEYILRNLQTPEVSSGLLDRAIGRLRHHLNPRPVVLPRNDFFINNMNLPAPHNVDDDLADNMGHLNMNTTN